MRILHVAHGWPPSGSGGTELYAAAVADAQARAGAAVAHWTPEGLPRRPRPFRATFDLPEAERHFAAALSTHRADIVHIHHLSGASLGLPAVARAAGARVVLTLHDFWLEIGRAHV